jgi:homoserine O-succinyltransferase
LIALFVDPDTHRAGPPGANISSSGNNGAALVIGLVNIMPPAAMRTIENLFRLLLNACASPGNIHLRLFSLSGGKPAEACGAPPDYESLNDLWDSPESEQPLDALIVTGTESRARSMEDESCWPDLQRICDWAGENTISTLWSCFSAHAAVLHLDNIHRQPFPEKLSGIFECKKASNHPIFKNMPAHFPAPHSRYNNLSEAELKAAGYEILSKSPLTGPDSFIKQQKNSQFLFLQGHLEYGAEMLFSEYCRDLKRFALGQSVICPKPPQNYFDPTALAAFAAATPEVLSSTDFINSVTARLSSDWQAPARRLYTAWLGLISEQKAIAARDSTLLDAPFAAGAFNSLRSSETHAHIAQP